MSCFSKWSIIRIVDANISSSTSTRRVKQIKEARLRQASKKSSYLVTFSHALRHYAYSSDQNFMRPLIIEKSPKQSEQRQNDVQKRDKILRSATEQVEHDGSFCLQRKK